MRRPKSAIQFILRGLLLPHPHNSTLLVFRPKEFFHELSRISKYSENTLRTSFSQAKSRGYIEMNDNLPRLTPKGLMKAAPFQSTVLPQGAILMIIFDIPESNATARRNFRHLLRTLGFEQVQKSGWSTRIDHRKALRQAAHDLHIDNHVEMYEALPVN